MLCKFLSVNTLIILGKFKILLSCPLNSKFFEILFRCRWGCHRYSIVY